MSHFLQLFCEKFIKTSKRDSFLEKVPVFVKSMISDDFSRNEELFATFSEKFIETSKGHSLLEKLPVLAKSMLLRDFSQNEPLFATFLRKVHQNLET